MQHRRMLRFEDSTLQRFDGVLTVSDADRDDVHASVPGRSRQTDVGDSHRSRHGVLRAARRRPRPSRASSSPARWTGCRTKTRCSSSATTCCRSFAPRNRASGCRSSAARRRPPSARSPTNTSRSPGTVRRRPAVHAQGRRLHRAAANRRRHAPQDLRSDGHGQGRGVHDGRRRRPARHARRARAHRRWTARVCRRRRLTLLRDAQAAPGHSRPPPARSSSNTTTGRPSPANSTTR